VKKYLPNESNKKYKSEESTITGYFCSNHLAGVQKSVIPIWDPTPIQGATLERVRIDVGDVGTITELGGFRVAYNILMDESTNILCGYTVPPNFSPFIPPGRRYSIDVNANVPVDLDNCGAFMMKKLSLQRPFFKGFKHDYRKSVRKYVQPWLFCSCSHEFLVRVHCKSKSHRQRSPSTEDTSFFPMVQKYTPFQIIVRQHWGTTSNHICLFGSIIWRNCGRIRKHLLYFSHLYGQRGSLPVPHIVTGRKSNHGRLLNFGRLIPRVTNWFGNQVMDLPQCLPPWTMDLTRKVK